MAVCHSTVPFLGFKANMKVVAGLRGQNLANVDGPHEVTTLRFITSYQVVCRAILAICFDKFHRRSFAAGNDLACRGYELTRDASCCAGEDRGFCRTKYPRVSHVSTPTQENKVS